MKTILTLLILLSNQGWGQTFYYFGEFKRVAHERAEFELGKVVCDEQQLSEELLFLRDGKAKTFEYIYKNVDKSVIVTDADGDIVARGKFSLEGPSFCEFEKIEASLERFHDEIPLRRVLLNEDPGFYTRNFFEDEKQDSPGVMRGVMIQSENYLILKRELTK